MTYQTTLSDADRAILSRLALPALRNESRTDDSTDYRAMQREMVSRYDWHDGETPHERNARILRAAGEPL